MVSTDNLLMYFICVLGGKAHTQSERQTIVNSRVNLFYISLGVPVSPGRTREARACVPTRWHRALMDAKTRRQLPADRNHTS